MSSEGSPSSKVKFVDEGIHKPHLVKHVPTQKYNRQEIQRRLQIENWMETSLKDLFESDVSWRDDEGKGSYAMLLSSSKAHYYRTSTNYQCACLV